MKPIIEARNLTKRFTNINAVEDLSFSIRQGDVYGFLGENGAGKSTTMRMLLGLIHPTSGSVYINDTLFNNNNRQLLTHIGAIIERPDLYLYLSGWDNLRFFANLSGKHIPDKRLTDVLGIVGLTGREKDKVKAYSQGMKQRLGIAIAMVHDPSLLILDEPTNGLDPQGIAEMRQLIISLSKDHGKTILISSHLLYEIEQVATRMLIIHKGKKMAEGTVAELLDPSRTITEIKYAETNEIVSAIRQSAWAPHVQSVATGTLIVKMRPADIPALNRWLVEQGIQVYQIESKHSLEDYFLSLTTAPHVQA